MSEVETKKAPIVKENPVTDSNHSPTPEVKEKLAQKKTHNISGIKTRKIVVRNVELSMIDFYKEHEQIINFAFAQSKPDINIAIMLL